MANCSQCGAQIPEGQEKCPSCGTRPMDLSVVATAHINLLKKKIEKEPSNARFHVELGDVYHKNNYPSEALAEYQKAVAIDANNYSAQIKSAQLYLSFKKYSEAESAFRTALHIDPRSTESLVGLFRTHYLQNKAEEAVVLGEKIVQVKPDNVEFHMLLKNLYQRKGNKEKALAELLMLETLTPNNELVVSEIATYHKETKNIEKMIEYYHKLLNLKIEDVDLGFEIGKYYYNNQEYDKAVECLNGLFKPGNIASAMEASIRAHLALAHYAKGNASVAENLIDGMQRANAQQMDQATQKQLAALYYKMGQSALKDNRNRRAVNLLEEAVAFDRETPDYTQLLNKTKNETTLSNRKFLRKVMTIGIGVVAACILIILLWILTHNKIIIQTESAEDLAVLIDGKPATMRVEKPGLISSPALFLGRHDVVVVKAGYEKWQGAANIGFGRSTRLDVKLVPICFSLQVASVPESANVMIDGKFAGKTPFASSQIMACPHKIELEHEGYAKWSATLTAKEKDFVDLGVIRLKNLTGKWFGKTGADGYGDNTTLSLTIDQTNTELAVKYSYKPKAEWAYSGKIKGRTKKGEFNIEGKVTFAYLNVFYWVKSSKKIVIRGKISDNWEKIEGTHYIEDFGEHTWWANRQK